MASNEESSSKASSSEKANISEELENFRQQWVEELQWNVKTKALTTSGKDVASSSSRDRNLLARSLYQMGISEERAGNPFKAVNFYAKACRLFPDIEQEFRVYHDSPKSSDTTTPAPESDDESNLYVSHVSKKTYSELDLSFQKLSITEVRQGYMFCQPETLLASDRTHISKLPYDILILILRYVAFPDFDLKSLENFGMVCQGFRFLARDPEVWRLACTKVWGEMVPEEYMNTDWRDMYLRRPRLNFHGVYISKVVYTRQGEQSFESTYNIYKTVEYFRYLRFFPDGTALMYTSPEDPKLIVPKLKFQNCRLSGIKTGHYELQSDHVDIFLQDAERLPTTVGMKFRRSSELNETRYENNFFIKLSIAPMGNRKPCSKLAWISYSVRTNKIFPATSAEHLVPRHTEVNLTEFKVNNSQFKPFLFSLVRSYTAVNKNL